jgi:hypothetical protein
MAELILRWLKSRTIRRILISIAVPLLTRYGLNIEDKQLEQIIDHLAEAFGIIYGALAIKARTEAQGPLPKTPAQARASMPPPTP